MLTEEQVKHVAKLARMDLTDEEISVFSKQLSEVLDYMEILNEVDTDGIQETSQVTGLKNVMEKDQVNKASCTREALLDCSELPIDSKQIRVKHAIK